MKRPVCALAVVVLVAGLFPACDKPGKRVENFETDAPVSRPAVSELDRNLLLNGDAESLVSSTRDTADSWSRTPDVVAMNYGGVPDEWQTSKPGCPDGRERYFRLPLAINEPSKAISQRVNLNSVGGDVDAGRIECALGGWFGGWKDGDASARLEIDFVNAHGAVLSTLATDAPDPLTLEKPATGHASMAQVTVAGEVPSGTRHIEVRLVGVRPKQKVDTNAVATADNLSLVLRKKADGTANSAK